MKKISAFAWMVLICSVTSVGAQPAEEPEQDETALITQLEQHLTGAIFVGRFTVTGSEEPPVEERYEIISANKTDEGDWWILRARIRYGDIDLTVPVPLEIIFSGDTPVITIDSLAIPGLGTFDARVLLHDNHYAGTWRHNETRGHLFGRIERAEQE